ncbi:hypothetical protein GCM10022261_13540 [Brevibacterium daeguense]|uniref:Uncharacterized protein n=1 Tax=Brevibacterium daeguense TaxID=909936 RepID=A0ABP8EIQ8_9MICO
MPERHGGMCAAGEFDELVESFDVVPEGSEVTGPASGACADVEDPAGDRLSPGLDHAAAGVSGGDHGAEHAGQSGRLGAVRLGDLIHPCLREVSGSSGVSATVAATPIT